VETLYDQLAKIVLSALKDKNLVLPSDADKLATKLASGKMKSEDWKFALENAREAKDSE
jgi:hypothetical protein